MVRPALELADLVRRYGAGYRRRHRLSRAQRRVLRAIETCRTAALGGHVEQCGQCAHTRVSYNSCRNRHCPKCQALAQARWLAQRKAELLPVPYYHVVFTLPAPLAEIAFYNPAVVYSLLFRTAAATLLTLGRDPRHLGAELGLFAVLHTWGQNLLHHPHVHCVVPGGGPAPDGARWIGCRPGFFLPVRVLSRLFRRLFLAALDQAFRQGKLRFFSALAPLRQPAAFQRYLAPWRRTEWVVYAKRPFAGPAAVLEYLGQYTHRVAISNHRLLALADDGVSFRWKDYRRAGREKHKVMTLAPDEFLRRFLLHTLPPGFPRIRYYGGLAARRRTAHLALCRHLLQAPDAGWLPPAAALSWRDLHAHLTGVRLDRCPRCGAGTMSVVETLAPCRFRCDSS